MYHCNQDKEDEQLDLIRAEEDKAKNIELSERNEQEIELKRQRRQEGQNEYADLCKTRKVAILKRKQQNKEEEAEFKSNQKNEKYNSTWEKVVSLIDTKEADYKGTKNVARMRQTILNRKKDYDSKK